MQLYGLKTCDTCKKALKELESVEFVDVRTTGVPHDVLVRALEAFGDALVNTRSTTWRNMPAEERVQDPLQMLKQHPTLMKRPLIVDGDAIHLGWTKEDRPALST
ncbi:MAG: ArsC/Spx/MgsR family protein [Pseudomonadota bacterium]